MYLNIEQNKNNMIKESECSKIIKAIYTFNQQVINDEKLVFSDRIQANNMLNAVLEAKNSYTLEILKNKKRKENFLVDVNEDNKNIIIKNIINTHKLSTEASNYLNNLPPQLINAIYYGLNENVRNATSKILTRIKYNSVNDIYSKKLSRSDCAILSEVIMNSLNKSEDLMNKKGDIRTKIEKIKGKDENHEFKIAKDTLLDICKIVKEEIKNQESLGKKIKKVLNYDKNIEKYKSEYAEKLSYSAFIWLEKYMIEIEKNVVDNIFEKIGEQSAFDKRMPLKDVINYFKVAKKTNEILKNFNYLTEEEIKKLEVHSNANSKLVSIIRDKYNEVPPEQQKVLKAVAEQVYTSEDDSI